MKTVLTLTTQFVNNQGALLQCYALSRYINSLDGYSCKVIDYLPKNWQKQGKIFPRPHTLKGLAKLFYTLFRPDYWYQFKYQRLPKIRKFIADYLPLTEETYPLETIDQNPPHADFYVCGSDQIWNTIIFKNDLNYFFNFVPEGDSGKLISYGASIADPWSEDTCKLLKPLLNRFSAISIREKGNLEQLNSLLENQTAVDVADPVFLLSAQEWAEFAAPRKIKEKYILCYCLDINPLTVATAKKMREMTGYKLVSICQDVRDKFGSDVVDRAIDPRDFVSYIMHAEFVVTNSFHCSAFSSIFRKNFFNIQRVKSNERIFTLQQMFGIDVIMTRERLNELTLENCQTDYSRSDELSQARIQFSKDFLNKALENE